LTQRQVARLGAFLLVLAIHLSSEAVVSLEETPASQPSKIPTQESCYHQTVLIAARDA